MCIRSRHGPAFLGPADRFVDPPAPRASASDAPQLSRLVQPSRQRAPLMSALGRGGRSTESSALVACARPRQLLCSVRRRRAHGDLSSVVVSPTIREYASGDDPGVGGPVHHVPQRIEQPLRCSDGRTWSIHRQPAQKAITGIEVVEDEHALARIDVAGNSQIRKKVRPGWPLDRAADETVRPPGPNAAPREPAGVDHPDCLGRRRAEARTRPADMRLPSGRGCWAVPHPRDPAALLAGARPSAPQADRLASAARAQDAILVDPKALGVDVSLPR